MEPQKARHIGGWCPPSSVVGCTFENKSHGECQIQIRYEADTPYESVVNIPHLKPSQSEHIGMQEYITDEGIGCRKKISSIKVTRADGRTQELQEPFEHGAGVQVFLLFTIDDEQFKSVKRVDKDGS